MPRKRPDFIDHLLDLISDFGLLLAEIYLLPLLAIQFMRKALRPQPVVERRTGPQYRLFNDRRQLSPAPARVWWWPFADPTPERTPQVVASSIFGMSLVLVTGLVTASQGKFNSLLVIPAYGVFLLVILTTRARRLAQVNE